MMWALVAIILTVTAAMILGTRSPSRVRSEHPEEMVERGETPGADPPPSSPRT